MCVYIYIYIYTHAYIYIYIYTHTHTHTHALQGGVWRHYVWQSEAYKRGRIKKHTNNNVGSGGTKQPF